MNKIKDWLSLRIFFEISSKIKRTISLDFGQILIVKHFSILIIPKKILIDCTKDVRVNPGQVTQSRVNPDETNRNLEWLESKLLHSKQINQKTINLKSFCIT